MGKRTLAVISLILLGTTGRSYAQETSSDPASKAAPQAQTSSATSTSSASNASATTPDHARAYYHYMLARRYKELAGIQNRPDIVERAVSEFKQAIEADPDSLFLRIELADLYARAGRPQDAIHEAEAVLQVNPNQVEAHRLLADVYFRSLADQNQTEKKAKDNLHKAIEQLEAVTRIEPSDTNSLVQLGRLYKADNQNAKAEDVFKKVLNSEPGSAGALFNLASVYVDQGDYADAISLLTKVPENDMDSRWLGLLAFAYSQNHQSDKAVATYEKALAEDPENEEIDRAYAEALMAAGKTAAARAELEKILKAEPDDGTTYLRLGRLDRQEGRFDQARQELERARSLSPDNVEISYELAQLEDSTGNDDKAVAILEKLVKDSERPNGQYTMGEANNRAIFLERLGIVYRNQEKYAQAMDTFRQIVALGKGQASRGEGLVIETLRLDRQPEKALEEATDAVKKNPNDRTLRLLKASIQGEQGHVEEAVKELQSMLDGKGDDVEIYRAIAQVDSQAKRFPDAEAAAHKALEISSKSDDEEFGHFLLGSIFEREKKYDLAEQEFKKVLSSDPLNAAAANYLGYMLADRGVRLDESVKYIQKALQLEPNNGAYLDSLGWAYFKMHRLDLAENQLERAARLITTDPTIHEHLGHIYLELGKKREAQAIWERALKEWPGAVGSDFDADQAAQLQRQLEQLRSTIASDKSQK